MALKRIMASPVCVPFWVAPWKRAMSVLLLLVASLQLPLASGINISRWPSWQYFPFTNASSLPANPVKRIEVQLLVNPNPPPEPHAVTLLKGVVAVSPTSRLSFPHSSIPPSSPAFSVSLCVFLTEDSTGAVRTLFSRGANTNQRTPSLALLKNSRRLLFKVTTLFRPEISATSARQLPLLRWSHVTLTSDGYRTLTLFLDGAPDGTLYTGSDVILGNGGPFALGRDHLLDGAAALVSGLKWFPYELTREQIANERREAFANLPQFGDLAQGEANARGVWDPDSKLEWKPSEQIVAEAGFVWRGEVAGSPPAADTPTFVGALSGGVKNGLEGQDNADILLKSKSCNSFPTMAQERTCPVSSFSPKSLLVDASTAVESESICIGDGSEELAEAQSFWELIHTNAGPVVELDRHSMKPEVRTVGRPNSEFVEEVARLAIARLSPFRTAARFLKPFYLAMDLLQGEGLQGSKEGSASNVPDVLEDGLDGPGVKRLQPGTPEPFHTGSPEGEKAYRARIAKQQFEEGRAAVVEGARAEGSGVQLRRLKQGLDLLRQAAEGGLGLAHLELAYVMARHSAEFEQKLQRTALDLLSEQVANRGSDLEGTVKSDEGRVSGGVVSIGGVSHQPDPRGAKLKGDDVTATQKLVEGGSMTSLESPDLEKRIPGDSSSETEGRNRWVLEGAGLRNGTPVVPWQQQITYHFLRATAAGVDEAFAALGYRTLFGLGVAQCNESARFFFEKAAEVAVQTWQRPGERVVVEGSLLTGALPRWLNERTHRADLLQIMAGRGHRAANLELGRWYLWGVNGVARDPARAARFFERARAGGNPHAAVGLAKMLLAGEGVAQNASKAREYYEDAAGKGDAEALNGLGYFTLHGQGGTEQNFSKAFEYFKRAADLGSQDAMVNMGAMQRAGLGIPRDDVAAWRNFRAGALQGHVPSAHHAALAASSGHGTERNPGQAAHWFRLMSETGPWAAHLQTGLSAFLNGDARGSLASYARAAELGYPPALYNAAWLLEKRSGDLGLTRGEGRLAAAVYLERIVAEGGPDGEGSRGVRADLRGWAHVRLGDCAYYEGGCRGRGDAAGHYRTAGELGNGQGQFSLAYLLERGTHGASHNLSEAERFYRLSGEHPNKGAVAAAALAIAKLKVVSCLRDYGLDIERWVGFVHLRVRNGLGALSNLVWWFCETALGRTNSSPGEEANGKADGAAFRGGDLGENGTPYLEGRVVETDGNGDALVERPPALLSGALKGFHSAREEWVLLALCVALGFTLGFRWVRQRSRRAASDG